MSLLVTNQHPMKITFIRDESKIGMYDKQDKISIGYLSSLIQEQRKKYKVNDIANILITSQHADNQSNTFRHQEMPKGKPKKYNDKWKKCKGMSQSQHKRLLTNLIGNNWNGEVNNGEIDQDILKNKKSKTSVVRSKVNANSDEERIERNRKLMAFHFKTFLSYQKQKKVHIEPIELKQTMRIYEKVTKQPTKQSGVIKNIGLENRIQYTKLQSIEAKNEKELKKYESNNEIILRQRKLGYKHKSLDTNLLKKNNKYISFNFKWSQVNNNQKFLLNDCF